MLTRWSYDLLRRLTQRGLLELDGTGDVDSLATELGEAIELNPDPWFNAINISEWLLNHDAVSELYVDDMALAGILERLPPVSGPR